MIAPLTIWFRGRSLREQRLLLVMAALVALVVLWLLVVRPLGDALADARERHGEAVIAQAEARAKAQTIRSLEKRGGAVLTQPLDVVIAQAAAEAGFESAQIEPESGGPGMLVSIAAVRPQAFFAWIGRLERDRGLLVTSLNATVNPDKTLAVQASFRARGR